VAAKVGPLWFIDDLEDLDVGFNGELAFGYQLIRFLALEFQTGGFWGEDPDGNVETELWGFPAVINLKASIPIAFLEPYGGIGVGGYFIHTEVDAPGTTRKDDDFVFGLNLFAGLAINLGRVFILGEVKYIGTVEADTPGEDVSLEGLALMFGAGFRF
jgi:opacity protein-like surface antigen